MGLLGRSSLPDAARSAFVAAGLTRPLRGPDRPLAWSPLAPAGWAVATPGGLVALLPTGELVDRPWTQVHRAAWEQESGMLAVWWVGSRRPTPLEIQEDATALPVVVHERVQSSVVLARDVVVPGGRTVWVALRKAVDGTLTTQAVPPPGVRLVDPAVAQAVTQARRALRDEVGT